MGKLAVFKYFSFLFLIVTFLVMFFTFAALFGGHTSPVGNTALAMLVYILPILIIANIVILAYWLLRRRWHWAAFPFITILCCIPYIGTIHQLRVQPSDTKAGLKIATYNVALFGRETSGFKAEDILTQMKKQKVDVLCFQEYLNISGDKKNSDSYQDFFPYMATGRNDMVIYSRYPIKQSKTIEFEQTNNSAMWADIDVNGQDIRVFNVHLQTTGINSTLRHAGKMALQGIDIENNIFIKLIYGNYTRGMLVRARQAEKVAAELKASKNPVVVCGDFNDVPYSYVYNTMLGDLTDGFKECGSGYMFTYRGNKKVRIDYIFHDKSLKGISYYMQDLSYSDHYPVFMKLEI